MNTHERNAPDFEELERVVKGEQEPLRVHLVELGIDSEIARFLVENVLDEEWVSNTRQTRAAYARQHVNVYAAMGYDFVRGWAAFRNMPEFKDDLRFTREQ